MRTICLKKWFWLQEIKFLRLATGSFRGDKLSFIFKSGTSDVTLLKVDLGRILPGVQVEGWKSTQQGLQEGGEHSFGFVCGLSVIWEVVILVYFSPAFFPHSGRIELLHNEEYPW